MGKQRSSCQGKDGDADRPGAPLYQKCGAATKGDGFPFRSLLIDVRHASPDGAMASAGGAR
jgi:hypothetical protein